MKPKIAFILVMIVTIACGASEVPQVDLDYTPLFDRFMSEATREEASDAATAELRTRLPEFRMSWANEGPKLLKAAMDLTDRPFKFAETRAALVVSRVPSLSHPLIISMPEFLRAVRGDRAQPDEIFVDAVFHEILHRYIADILGQRETILLKKYSAETIVVRNHLHLFALQEQAYEELGMNDVFERAVAAEKQLKGATAFARAREIVKIEGASAFVSELKKTGKPNP
ncbi:MAG TPA: hypothetical protein VIM71_00040 [Lacunisphaera sp.]